MLWKLSLILFYFFGFYHCFIWAMFDRAAWLKENPPKNWRRRGDRFNYDLRFWISPIFCVLLASVPLFNYMFWGMISDDNTEVKRHYRDKIRKITFPGIWRDYMNQSIR